MILGLHHAGFSVPSLDEALAFYCGVLGGERVTEDGGWDKGTKGVDEVLALRDSAARFVIVQLGVAFVEIFEFSSPTPEHQDKKRTPNHHGITHICLVVDDCEAEYARLKKNGMTFDRSPLDVGSKVFTYGRDPFGNLIELIELKEGDPFPNNYAA